MNMALSVAQLQENENYTSLYSCHYIHFLLKTENLAQVVDFIDSTGPKNRNLGEMVSNLCGLRSPMFWVAAGGPLGRTSDALRYKELLGIR